jgi:hypothetical protein
MILNEISKITEQWRQYFQNLLTDPNITGTEITQQLGEELEKDIERTEEQWNKNDSPTTDDVRKATERLKNNTAWTRQYYSTPT